MGGCRLPIVLKEDTQFGACVQQVLSCFRVYLFRYNENIKPKVTKPI